MLSSTSKFFEYDVGGGGRALAPTLEGAGMAVEEGAKDSTKEEGNNFPNFVDPFTTQNHLLFSLIDRTTCTKNNLPRLEFSSLPTKCPDTIEVSSIISHNKNDKNIICSTNNTHTLINVGRQLMTKKWGTIKATCPFLPPILPNSPKICFR